MSERPDLPDFRVWERVRLEQYARDTWQLGIAQHDTIQHLQCSLKDAIQANRELILQQARKQYDDWK